MLEEKNKVDVVEYNGRKTSPIDSERRRKAILEAALRIVVKEGVRGVRHRAVAKEAEVPLSATTYYFKDISDLIADTFVLFAEVQWQVSWIRLKQKLWSILTRVTQACWPRKRGSRLLLKICHVF